MGLRSRLSRFVGSLGPRQRQRLARLRRPAFAGTLRRTSPLSDRYGYDRGTPVDRHYIASFLAEHRRDIRGRALEIKNCAYLRRFGSGISVCDVLDIDPRNPHATVVADLTSACGIQSDQYDCFVLTQTLHLIFDFEAALVQTHRILKPGGVLLLTVPGISRTDRTATDIDYWRFTATSCRRMIGDVFGPENITVRSYGNVFTATGFLMGMAAEEFRQRELDACDPNFPVIVAVRAVKL